jgi:steroid delta-isomerase-like uncharacterized protein
MATSTNISVLRQAFKFLNAGNVNGVVGLMRPNFIINIAGVPYQQHGQDAWRKNAQMLSTSLPDAKVEIEDIIAADDKVAVRVRLRGTHLGEFLGCRPTGKTIDYISHEIYRFEDGELAEEWICSDSATLLRQLGALSTKRLVSMWLSGYRFWAGLAVGAVTGGICAMYL